MCLLLCVWNMMPLWDLCQWLRFHVEVETSRSIQFIWSVDRQALMCWGSFAIPMQLGPLVECGTWNYVYFRYLSAMSTQNVVYDVCTCYLWCGLQSSTTHIILLCCQLILTLHHLLWTPWAWPTGRNSALYKPTLLELYRVAFAFAALLSAFHLDCGINYRLHFFHIIWHVCFLIILCLCIYTFVQHFELAFDGGIKCYNFISSSNVLNWGH